MGIEPTSKAWEAFVLPLNYTRKIVYSFYHRHESLKAIRLADGPASMKNGNAGPLNYTRG